MKRVYWVIPGTIAGRCGPEMAPWDCWNLYAGGIKAIASLTDPGDAAKIREANIEHLPLYFPAMLLTNEHDYTYFLSFVSPFLDFADRVIKAGKPMMVHCTFGCDRTGAMISIYLIARHGYTAEQAIKKVREHQPPAMSAEGYEQVVYHYEKLINGGNLS
ncbi:MAG: dual specificity protein phosphatase family protein [Planctomycetota bacterium]|nr:dual specificity protein phosphatase family protein [Planctomycetota bacterium]MDA1138075.1 dual specificity protein phosphatase family protein [Planctomycetota bacterium]